jgi:hypothetical protein
MKQMKKDDGRKVHRRIDMADEAARVVNDERKKNENG